MAPSIPILRVGVQFMKYIITTPGEPFNSHTARGSSIINFENYRLYKYPSIPILRVGVQFKIV